MAWEIKKVSGGPGRAAVYSAGTGTGTAATGGGGGYTPSIWRR